MSQIGVINTNESLDISNIYEMSIFTNHNLSLPLPRIMCSNDGITWVLYSEMLKPYMYLSELMANFIKVTCDEIFTIHYNTNLKKK